MVERCAAFKCPTVAYQLAGAKKIQQVPACWPQKKAVAAVLLHSWIGNTFHVDACGRAVLGRCP
jgi:hypothetical protein